MAWKVFLGERFSTAARFSSIWYLDLKPLIVLSLSFLVLKRFPALQIIFSKGSFYIYYARQGVSFAILGEKLYYNQCKKQNLS